MSGQCTWGRLNGRSLINDITSCLGLVLWGKKKGGPKKKAKSDKQYNAAITYLASHSDLDDVHTLIMVCKQCFINDDFQTIYILWVFFERKLSTD